MGYDVYGISPKINKVYPKRYNEIMKEYGDGEGWLKWGEDIPEEVKDEYFELKDQYQTDNPGEYFRNNVWFWRPLWNFVCRNCEDILEIEDMEGGDSNSGYEVSARKAELIGKRLSALLADGTVDEAHKLSALNVAEAKAHNEIIEEELEDIKKACEKEHGEDLVPAKYPEPYNTQWNETYAKKDWTASYPFEKENVENFAKFCLESGGFSIC